MITTTATAKLKRTQEAALKVVMAS